jgi:hypothetical protein
MSVLSRKRAAEAEQDRMRQLAWVAVVTRAAVPMAKTAGMAARVGARSAATWAAPRVNGARAWAAPRIERSGLAIRDTVAPRIYDVFVSTARRVDVTAPHLDDDAPRRRWPRAVAGTAMLAAAGAAAAVVLQRRKNERAEGAGGAPGPAADADTGPQTTPDGQQRSDADGSGGGEDVSRQSPAT